MQSRMDKYYETSNVNNNDNSIQDRSVVGSRTKRNQQLYREVSNLEIEDFDVNSNVSIIGESSSTIDIDKIRDMLDKKYREEPKNKSIGTTSEQDMKGVNLDETREYDLRSVMERAKSDKEVNYEEDRLKKLGNTSYDILKSLDIYNNKEDEIVEEPINVSEPEGYAHEDTIAEVFETKVSSKDQELQDLINTITAKEMLQFDESTKDLDPLDILSDLRGDDDKTKVMGALSFGDTTQVSMEPTSDTQENTIEMTNEVETSIVEDKTEEIEINRNVNVDKQDFDDFKDLKDDGNVLVKVLVFLIIVLLILGCVIFANKYLGLGLF